MNKIFGWSWLTSILVLSLADSVTTFWCLSIPGIGERNHYFVMAIDILGLAMASIVFGVGKLIVRTGMFFIAHRVFSLAFSIKENLKIRNVMIAILYGTMLVPPATITLAVIGNSAILLSQ